MTANLPILATTRTALHHCGGHAALALKCYWPTLAASFAAVIALELEVWWAFIVFSLVAMLETLPWVTAWHRFFIRQEHPSPTMGRREWRYFLMSLQLGVLTAIAVAIAGLVAAALSSAADSAWVGLGVLLPVIAFLAWLLAPLMLLLPDRAMGAATSFGEAAAMMRGQRWRFVALVALVPIVNGVLTGLFSPAPLPIRAIIDLITLLTYPIQVGMLSLAYIWFTTRGVPARETPARVTEV